MDFAVDPDHELIAAGVRQRCAPFDDDYWSRCDERHEFPWDFYRAMADDGWVGMAFPRSTAEVVPASPKRPS